MKGGGEGANRPEFCDTRGGFWKGGVTNIRTYIGSAFKRGVGTSGSVRLCSR
jgi:hypothetical protein